MLFAFVSGFTVSGEGTQAIHFTMTIGAPSVHLKPEAGWQADLGSRQGLESLTWIVSSALHHLRVVYWVTTMASRAPACLRAWTMAIKSRGVTPMVLSASVTSRRVAPTGMVITL